MRQFTATVYILQGEKVLLLLHPKLAVWLPPGGHLEEGETPPECARREALEETGLHIELIKEEHLWIERPNAVSCERPFMCLIENIPPHKDQGTHQHIDFIFLGYPTGGKLHPLPKEQLRWFSLEEVLALKPDIEIFADTQETLCAIYRSCNTGTHLTHLGVRITQ